AVLVKARAPVTAHVTSARVVEAVRYRPIKVARKLWKRTRANVRSHWADRTTQAAAASCADGSSRMIQDERGAAWVGQFGTTCAPRWPHFAHTKPSPSVLESHLANGRHS